MGSPGWLADGTSMQPAASLPERDWIHDLGLISNDSWSAEWAGKNYIPTLYLQLQTAFYEL